ncbi:MAG: RNA-binding S4 domain-containing protein [Lachnospiraceae bacterium]|jgi:ribosome-associated protein|nr:RNA-binding S4 domain-containing protein [bacterium]MBQ2183146.1 RNA-binding S4 domain-containing protein [Lachnospiraceae bacterium]MBR4412637.1 RNA-binding S4 domain-containing protein [Lachnospiraceae bacterium]
MEFYLKDDFIKLGQLLKAANLVENGADAKFEIQDGKVFVNGEVEYQRGKKIYKDDIVKYNGKEIVVKKI